MLELFRSIPPGQVGVLTPPAWPFVKRGLTFNTAKVQTYYRQWVKPVRSTHFLVRLLQSIAVPKAMPLERYYANVDAIALNLAMALGMSSTYAKGRVHKGVFYGPTTPEILLATDDRFDFEHVHQHWQDAAAVTPLLHAKSDVGLHLPNGTATSREDGLSVILINVPMLAVQYRAFVQDQLRRGVQDTQSVMYFIGAYVLPNMLPAQLELCLFNRLVNRALYPTKPMPTPMARHAFALANYEGALDHALDQALENAKKSSRRFSAILQSLPSVQHASLYEALLMPDIAPNRQVDWVLVLSRLKVVSFLFALAQDQLLTRNQLEVNQILRSLRAHDIPSVFRESLPIELYFEAQDYIDELLSAAKRSAL